MASTSASLRALAGAGTRGNAYLFAAGKTQILLDVGESDRDWLADLDEPPALTVISHVHADHLGALARFRERFPTARVVSTPETRDLIVDAIASWESARAAALSDTVEPLKFRSPLTVGGLEVELHPAGHIPGAAMTTIRGEGYSFGYTGDFSFEPRAWATATKPLDVDILLMEGALAGAKRLDGWRFETAARELRAWIAGGPSLMAVDTHGLGPEMVSLLGKEALVHEHIKQSADAESVDLRGARDAFARGEVVIAAGADLEPQSIAGILAEELVSESSARIVVFNSIRPRTRAHKLSMTSRRSRILGWPGQPRLKARVRRLDWPLHATAGELVSFAECSSPGLVLLTHGREEGLYHLRRVLQKSDRDWRIEVLKPGLEFILSNEAD